MLPGDRAANFGKCHGFDMLIWSARILRARAHASRRLAVRESKSRNPGDWKLRRVPARRRNLLPSSAFPSIAEGKVMRRRISMLKARGAAIVGHGAMLKTLVVSLALIVVAFVGVAFVYVE